MKKLLSIISTTLIALSIICIAAFTSSAVYDVNISVYSYDNLKYHIENSNNEVNLTIYLSDDIDSSLIYEDIDFSKGEAPNITLDLNGHHLKLSSKLINTNTINLFNVNREVNFTIIDSKNSSNGYIEFNSKGIQSTIIKLDNEKANFKNYNVNLRKCYETNYRIDTTGFGGSAVDITKANNVLFLGGKVESYKNNDSAIKAGMNNNNTKYINSLVFSGNVQLYCEQPSGNGTLILFGNNIASTKFYGCSITCGTTDKLAVYNASSLDFAQLIGDKQGLKKINNSTDSAALVRNGTYSYSGNFANRFKLEYNTCEKNTNAEMISADFHVFTCKNCGGFHSVDAHTPKTVPGVDATCTKTGLTAGSVCEFCNKIITAQKATSPLGHSFGAYVTTKEPTYFADGVSTSTCSRCDSTQTQSIPKLILERTEEITSTSTTTSITLQWTPVDGATGYRVYQYKGSGWTKIKDVAKNTLTVSSLESGITYAFKIKAYAKNETEVVWGGTTLSPYYESTVPAKVTSIKAGQSTSAIKLSWPEVVGANDGYIVYQYNPSTKSFVFIQRFYEGTSCTVKSLKAGTTYYFKVCAAKVLDEKFYCSEDSDIVKTTTLPATVTSLKAAQSASAIKLTWTKVTGVTSYRVYKYNSATKKFEKYKNTTATSLTVPSLKAGTTYYFIVRACKTYNGSNYWSANSAVLKTTTLPSAVTSLKAKTIAKTAVTLSWSKVTGATGYAVYQYKDGKWVRVATVKSNAATIKSLKSATNQYFKVRAYKTCVGKNYYGGYSDTLKVKTK